jgi:2-polyprenyl-6-methoxyphenol hydroxylase-like FAD-dependent oxidoreductase
MHDAGTRPTDFAAAPRGTAVVVGGSVGGLFAANLLARRGWRVDVYERVAEGLQSRGAGIAMHDELEVLLAAAGAPPQGAVGGRVDGRSAYDRTGRLLAYHPYPQVLTSWARVFNALRDALPAAQYHAGREIASIEVRATGAVLRLADGEEAAADLVVGADGFRSTLRALLAPEVRPRYAGYVAWRGLVEEAALSPRFRAEVFERYAFLFPGGSQFIGYCVAGRDDSLAEGRRRYNFLWYYPVEEASELPDLLTDESGRRHDFSIPPPLIRTVHLEALRKRAAQLLPAPFHEAVERATQLMIQPIYDVESRCMAFGRVALAGDAAFVARPHVGIGVLKAAQDAAALADCLDEACDVPQALARYDARRAPPGRAAVRLGRRLGAFIERRLDAPWSDPALDLPPERVIEISARLPAEQEARYPACTA